VLLILGLLTSMFTAIFCARVFFDVVERTRFLTTLKMFQFLPETKIDFVGYRHLAVTASLVAIGVGAVAAIYRGEDLLDIDFTGGSSVHVMLEQPAETDDVRNLLEKPFASLNTPFTLTGMSMVPGQTLNNMFKVDAKVDRVEQLEEILQSAFQQASGGTKLATYSLDYSDLRETVLTTTSAASATSATTKDKAEDAEKSAARDSKEVESKTPESKTPESKTPESKTPESKSESPAPDKAPPLESKSKPEEPAAAKADAPAKSEEPAKDEAKEAAAPKAPEGASLPLPADSVLARADSLQ
jgi:SecD/SecF fusion protein